MQYRANQGGIMPLSAGGYAPTLAKVTAAQAAKTAGAFLGRVLSGGETAALTADSAASPLHYSGADFSFSAQLKLGGVPSPIHVQLQVDSTDGAVTYFSRDDVYEALVGTLPSASPKVAAGAAASALSAAVKLELQYVDADDGTSAVLRYVPLSGDDLYVDAQTGAVVDLTSVWDGLNAAAGGSGYDSLRRRAGRHSKAPGRTLQGCAGRRRPQGDGAGTELLYSLLFQLQSKPGHGRRGLHPLVQAYTGVQ